MRVSTTTLGIFTIIWGECYFTAGWDWESQHTHTEGFFLWHTFYNRLQWAANLPTPSNQNSMPPIANGNEMLSLSTFLFCCTVIKYSKIVVHGHTKIDTSWVRWENCKIYNNPSPDLLELTIVNIRLKKDGHSLLLWCSLFLS